MTPQHKQPERDAIAASIEAFKQQGGKIQRVPRELTEECIDRIYTAAVAAAASNR